MEPMRRYVLVVRASTLTLSHICIDFLINEALLHRLEILK